MSSGGGGGGGGCRSRVSMSADVNERAIVVDVIVVVVVVETKMITNKQKKSADRPRSTGFALFCVLVCYPHRYPHRYPTPLPPTPFWLRVVGSFFLFVVRAASIVFANRRRQPMPPPPHSLLQPLPDQLFGFIVDCTLPSFASVVVFSSCFAVPFHRRPTRRCVSTSSLVDIVIGRDPIRFRFYAHCFVFGFVLASNIVPYSANQLELWDSASWNDLRFNSIQWFDPQSQPWPLSL